MMCNLIMLDHQIIFFMYLSSNISHYEVNKILIFKSFDFDFDQSASILSIWIHSNVLEKKTFQIHGSMLVYKEITPPNNLCKYINNDIGLNVLIEQRAHRENLLSLGMYLFVMKFC